MPEHEKNHWRIDEQGRLQRIPDNGKGHIRFSAQESFELWTLLTANLDLIRQQATKEQQKSLNVPLVERRFQ